jgi:hypothetical protein
MNKLTTLLIILVILNACRNTNKNEKNVANQPKRPITNSKNRALINIDTSGVEGIYIEKPSGTETGSCPIQVIITKALKGYHYQLTLSEQNYTGTATLSTNDEQTYLTFEGITWAEYEGDVSNDTTEQTTDSTTPETPVGIGALLQNNEMSIQNTGNSMNYYVKLAGCDRKYITLIKK